MKKTEVTISTLAEDIRQLDPKTDGQTDMLRFCHDHQDPVCLQDGKAVFAETGIDQFLDIFDMRDHHYFLPPTEVLRLGVYHTLHLYGLTALIMKSIWEMYLSEMIEYKNGAGVDLEALLRNKKLVDQYLPDFAPSNSTIFSLVKQVPYDTRIPVTRANLNLVVKNLLEGNNFLADPAHIARSFTPTRHSEKVLLKKASPARQEQYWRLRDLWKNRAAEFETKLLLLEEKKRININVEDSYFQAFGALEIKKTALENRTHRYSLVLKLIETHPDLSLKALLKHAGEMMKAEEKEFCKIRSKYVRSQDYLDRGTIPAHGTSGTNFLDYEHACKTLLKKLYFLLHPDMYSHRQLSEIEKQRLNSLWLELMKGSEEELRSFSPGLLLYTHPDYYRLLNLLKRACEILQVDIDDLELGDQLDMLIMKGSSAKELIRFLEEDLESLQVHLTNLELVQYEYAYDQRTAMYREALQDKERHTGKLECAIQAACKKISSLKTEIITRFKPVEA